MMKMQTYRTKRAHTWWSHDFHSMLYICKQTSGVFLVLYALLWTFIAVSISNGPMAFGYMLNVLRHPVTIVFHFIAFFFIGIHSVTWLKFMPGAMLPRMLERIAWKNIPRAMALLPHMGWRTLEWLIFVTGGTITTFVMMIPLIATGVLVPFGFLSEKILKYEYVYGVLHNPIVAIIVALMIILVGVHGSHRVGLMFGDLNIKGGTIAERMLYGVIILSGCIALIALLT